MEFEKFRLEEIRPGRWIWIQETLPVVPHKGNVMFFNPLLDERKRSAGIQASVERALLDQGWRIIRWDYVGTGDSGGTGLEFDPEESLKDGGVLGRQILDKNDPLIAFGIRWGADFALTLDQEYGIFSRLVLVEPVGNGKRFLMGQRLRRDAFEKIHRIPSDGHQMNINGHTYEDFQGFPLSERAIQFIESLPRDPGSLSQPSSLVHIIKLTQARTHRAVNQFVEFAGKHHPVLQTEVGGEPFWDSLTNPGFDETQMAVLQAVHTSLDPKQ